MTAHARVALADCEHALADFEASANTVFQRSRWIAVITLLRTVGFVLKDVDRPTATAERRLRIDAAWARLKSTKPEPRIFHEFIDAERSQAVHLYKVRAAVNITVRPGGGGSPSGQTTCDFMMTKGPFAGQDPRELCKRAIAFWRDYLDGIDERAVT
jgi:hypothetical protein